MSEIRYRFGLCPAGCVTIDYQVDTVMCVKPVFHNHRCHRFPSLTTEYVEVKG